MTTINTELPVQDDYLRHIEDVSGYTFLYIISQMYSHLYKGVL